MFWIIMTALSISTIIIGIILCKIIPCSDIGADIIFISAVATFVFGAILNCINVEEKNFLAKHKLLSQYTENYIFNSEIEKALINSKKYDFNEELINKKASIENYSFFYIRPKELKELKYLS